MNVGERIYKFEGAVIEQKNQYLITFGLGASAGQMRICPMQTPFNPRFGEHGLDDSFAVARGAPYVRDGRHVNPGQAVVLWWHVPEKGDAA